MKFTQIIAGFAVAATAVAVAVPGDCGPNPHSNCKRVAVPEPAPEPAPEPIDCGSNPHSNCKRTPAPEPADCNIKWHPGC